MPFWTGHDSARDGLSDVNQMLLAAALAAIVIGVPPASAQAPRQDSAEEFKNQGKLGTGHGRSEESRVTVTQFERATPYPEEVITIQYDTHANLVAMGVIDGPRIARPAPFPGQFVPDPR